MTDTTSTDVLVVGGGPAGLSAALFTAKNGLDTTVFDTDGTWMHKAHLFNYLGIESEDGTAFMEDAREQVAGFGADLHGETEITEVKTHEDHFHAITEEDSHAGDYLILATGADRSLAEDLGCAFDGDIVDVDVTMETSVDDAYAIRSGRRSSRRATAPPPR
jgi:thioredoxin reductase